VNERWVCKRCFADNDETAAACHRCGLIRGAESTDADQTAWGASQEPEAAASGSDRGGVIRQLLRFWWIPAAAIALAVGYFTTAQRGDDGTLATAGNVTVTDLRVGDCFNFADVSDKETEIGDVDGVPCTELHAYEVFAVANYKGSAYPATSAAMTSAFGEVCIPPFESYVGIPFDRSALYASALTPTEEGWNDGERRFICHLFEEGEGMITGSQRGAHR
jgi:Septum formation